MDLRELQRRAGEVRLLCEAHEAERYGRSWNTAELALGFMGDVGDLAKLIQAHIGVRGIDDHEAKLEHELADCLWSVLVLAERCGVDLESAFAATMDQLESRLTKED